MASWATLEADKGLVLLRFSRPARIVSSVPVLHRVVDGVAVVEVGEGFDRRDLLGYYREVEEGLGAGRLAVMLTAARLPRSS